MFFARRPVRAHHLPVIGGEHHNGVVADAGVVDRLQQPAHVPIQIGRHRIIDAHHLRDPLALTRAFEPSPLIRVGIILRQVIRRQREPRRLPLVREHRVILRRHILPVPRVVRRADGQEQRERLARARIAFDLADRQVGLHVRLIAIDRDLLRAVGMVIGLEVLVVEVVGGPKAVEAEPVRAGRRERVLRIGMIAQLVGPKMPLADIPRVVALPGQHLRQKDVVRFIRSSLITMPVEVVYLPVKSDAR